MDDGGSGKRGYGRLLSEWVHQNCSDSVMTNDQRLDYNIRQLGLAGAVEFELKISGITAASDTRSARRTKMIEK